MSSRIIPFAYVLVLLLSNYTEAERAKRNDATNNQRHVLYFLLNFCSVLLVFILVMTVVLVGIEVNCPLWIPKPVVWISDLARDAHDKHDMKEYFRKKILEEEASLREHNLLSDNDPCLKNLPNLHFKVGGIGTHKYADNLTQYELLLKHHERKLKEQRRLERKKRKASLLKLY